MFENTRIKELEAEVADLRQRVIYLEAGRYFVVYDESGRCWTTTVTIYSAIDKILDYLGLKIIHIESKPESFVLAKSKLSTAVPSRKTKR